MAEKLDSTRARASSLKRTKVGKFNINNANLLDDLLKIGQTTHMNLGASIHQYLCWTTSWHMKLIDEKRTYLTFLMEKQLISILHFLNNPPLNLLDRKVVFLTNKGKRS